MARRGSADLTYGAGRPAQNRTAPAQRSCAHAHDAPARVPCVGSSVSYKSLCACARTRYRLPRMLPRRIRVVLPCPRAAAVPDSLETVGPRETIKILLSHDRRRTSESVQVSALATPEPASDCHISRLVSSALARAQVSLLGRIRLGRIRLGRIRLGRRALGRNGARPG